MIYYYDLKYSVDLVIHLGPGLSGVRDSLDKLTEYWEQNDAGQRLFQYFKDTRILYASSSTAHEGYGKALYVVIKYRFARQIAFINSVGMRFTDV